MAVDLIITTLGDKFRDYRQDIPGDSFDWGPAIDAKTIKYFAFHHSVTKQTAKTDGDWKKECDAIANLHIKAVADGGRGWDGVGYRFIICSDGTVAYVGDLSHGGSAVGGNNHQIFSACFVGDFTKELPTSAQVHSAHLLAKWFLDNMPQYPNLDSWDDVIGHQDAAALLKLSGAEPTACPGSNWRAAGDSLRDRIINDHWDGYPDPKPTTVTPAPQPDDSCEKKLAEKEKTIENLNTQISKLQSEHSAKDTTISSLQSQVSTITIEVESLRPQAKELTELKVLYGQLEKDRQDEKLRWDAAETLYRQKIAGLEGTSYTKAKNSVLIQQLVKNFLHL